MAYEDKYKEFEQYLASGNREWKNVRETGRWQSDCKKLK